MGRLAGGDAVRQRQRTAGDRGGDAGGIRLGAVDAGAGGRYGYPDAGEAARRCRCVAEAGESAEVGDLRLTAQGDAAS